MAESEKQPTDNATQVEYGPSVSQTAASTPTSGPIFKLWNPPAGGTPVASFVAGELEPTAAEVAAAYQAQSKRAERLQNAPLMTQQMRDRQHHERLKKWPNCAIRIRFHNQMQLEKSFPSTSKIKAVYAFVRDCLNDETKSIKFVLYQPPARELKVSDVKVRDKTLLELQLAPASVLLLRFLSDELNDREKLPPLQDSILSAAEDLPRLIKESEARDGNTDMASRPTSSQTQGNVEQKLARFLKLPGRK